PLLAGVAMFVRLWGLEGPAWGDSPLLRVNALRLLNSFSSGSFLVFLENLAGTAQPHPPLGYLPLMLGEILGFAGGHSRLFASLCALLLIADAWRRQQRGPWPMFLLLCSPMCWQYSWEYGWDLAGAACVLQAVHWAVASDGLQKRRESLLFGLWAVAGVLTKYTVPFYLIFPCFVLLCGAAMQPGRRRNLALVVGLGLLLLLPWLFWNRALLAPYIGGSFAEDTRAITMNGRSWAERLSPSGLLYYPAAIKDALGWPTLLLLMLGFWWDRRSLFVWAACGGLLGLSLMPAAVDRYALTALCLLVGSFSAVDRLPQGQLLGAVLGLGLLVGSWRSFHSPLPQPPSYQHSIATLAWPSSGSYAPFQVEKARFLVDESLRDLLKMPEPYGLRLPFDGRLPDTGVYLEVARSLGWQGDILVEREPQRPPSPEVQSLLSVGKPGDTTVLQQAGWLPAAPPQRVSTADGTPWEVGLWRRAP
ncbi:MAG TPA: hypothetical protein PLA94_06785, partial [Myxococcota bacterium]|nr:hypothetical protein [Myxococcota bacterium]